MEVTFSSVSDVAAKFDIRAAAAVEKNSVKKSGGVGEKCYLCRKVR